MTSTLLSLTLLAVCTVADSAVQQSVAVGSSAVLANVGNHDFHQDEDEASGRVPAGIIRREANSRAEAASELEEQAERKVATKEVSWETCENGACKCASRRRMVIRYQRERKAMAYADQKNTLTNWHFRSRARPYVSTSEVEFSKGFKKNATDMKLQMCGGDAAWSKDCLVQPEACSFDDGKGAGGDKNPYDAKAGEYCCSGEKEYCSYKCESDETFTCPSLTVDINFPGGMDPAGGDVPKKCYMAQYPHGMNPESATDADKDETAEAATVAKTTAP